MHQADARCKDCDYPLKGLPSGQCPECGREFDWNKRTTFKLGDEVGTLRGMFIIRKRAMLRLALVLVPGLLVLLLMWGGWVNFGDWCCLIVLAYPFWVLACTVCALAFISPTGLLSTLGAMTLGIVIALPFCLLFLPLGLWCLTPAIPAGLISGLLFKHMELNNML